MPNNEVIPAVPKPPEIGVPQPPSQQPGIPDLPSEQPAEYNEKEVEVDGPDR